MNRRWMCQWVSQWVSQWQRQLVGQWMRQLVGQWMRQWTRQWMRRSLGVWLLGMMLWLCCSGTAQAGVLADRLAAFPDWQSKPPLHPAQGDLAYPDWFAGTWTVTTTLIDLAAPLAPDLITPGFESNRPYLSQPIEFQARFVAESPRRGRNVPSLLLQVPSLQVSTAQGRSPTLISDRAFNGLNLAKAYLDGLGKTGNSPVLAVKVDPSNPNRQITLLRGDRQLVSTLSDRATESANANEFITTELFQQEFRGAPQVYFNIVETTTAYTHHPAAHPPITADQVTAIYLSPQDPDYFKAGERPVALYRYRMEFEAG